MAKPLWGCFTEAFGLLREVKRLALGQGGRGDKTARRIGRPCSVGASIACFCFWAQGGCIYAHLRANVSTTKVVFDSCRATKSGGAIAMKDRSTLWAEVGTDLFAGISMQRPILACLEHQLSSLPQGISCLNSTAGSWSDPQVAGHGGCWYLEGSRAMLSVLEDVTSKLDAQPSSTSMADELPSDMAESTGTDETREIASARSNGVLGVGAESRFIDCSATTGGAIKVRASA